MSGNARSSHHRCSVRRGALIRNFAKSTGKHLHQSRFFNKVAGQPFLQNTSGQLLLKCLKKISKWKWWTKLLFQKSNCLMFYTSTVSYFHVSFFYIFSYSIGGFLSNWISSRDEILIVSSLDQTHVQTIFFIPGRVSRILFPSF